MEKKSLKDSLRPIPASSALNSNSTFASSRRNFIKTGFFAASGVLAATGSLASINKGGMSNTADPLSCIDYGKSFLCNTAEFNSVRMWIESRTIIFDTKTGKSTVYYQGASCKSENTFGERDLFYKDNYDFLPVFGDGKVLVFRRHVNKRGEAYRSIKKMEDMWGRNPVIYTPVANTITELDSFEKIRDATAAGVPIVSQTEFENKGTGLRAVIEAPCKTINISHIKKIYQVDTGPVAFPDLSKECQIQIDCLHLAFIAFRADHFADFVIEAPTPIKDQEKEVATIYHYSKMATMQVKNRLFALGNV